MKEQFFATTAILGIIFILAVLFLTPYAIIWSLNTLFPILAIPYNIQTWIATLFLCLIFNPAVSLKVRS